jgi:manganese transport system substrate-binding protein
LREWSLQWANQGALDAALAGPCHGTGGFSAVGGLRPAPRPQATEGADGPGADRPLVLTSFTVLADLANNVACGKLRVESITRPGAEIHDYEPTPSDLRRAQDAQLVLMNGLNLELWAQRFLDSAKGADQVVVSEGWS